MPLDTASTAAMRTRLDAMKAAHLRAGPPPVGQRIEWLDAAIALIVDNRDALKETISADYGHRSFDQTDFADLAASIAPLKHAKKHVARWMSVDKRRAEFPLNLFGAKAAVHFQPKGVVGIVSPWNFPVGMVFMPLAGVFAAGNRAMVKPSEYTPATSALLESLIAKFFDADVMSCMTGGPDVGAAFTALPFDHLLFTGSTSVGRHVMRAAAENLTPVTLELGGKSPTIIGPSADMQKAAARIMHGKTLNAGQICVSPDYVLVPEGQERAFAAAAASAIETMYPTGLKDNADYTSIVNRRHFERLNDLLADARAKGAEVIALNPKDEDFTQQPHNKIAPHLLLGTTDDMQVMQDEIFGPLLPVRTYRNFDDAVAEVNARPRPLALYYFGDDKAEIETLVTRTTAGGMSINDTVFHVAQEDLPFGGIGPSGMGHYHGTEGFLTFSHAKSVFTQTGSELIRMLRPPYGATFRKQIDGRVSK